MNRNNRTCWLLIMTMEANSSSNGKDHNSNNSTIIMTTEHNHRTTMHLTQMLTSNSKIIMILTFLILEGLLVINHREKAWLIMPWCQKIRAIIHIKALSKNLYQTLIKTIFQQVTHKNMTSSINFLILVVDKPSNKIKGWSLMSPLLKKISQTANLTLEKMDL